MYSISVTNGNNTIEFYNDIVQDASVQLMNPSLNLTAGAAGSLEFTILPSNVAYNELHMFSSTIGVFRDGNEIWRGRILKVDYDYWNRGHYTVEGALAFLNDTQLEPLEGGYTTAEFLLKVLDEHNDKVSDDRKLYRGNVTVEGSFTYAEKSFKDSLSALKSNLTDPFGGYLNVRIQNGTPYVDYVHYYENQTAQSIVFNQNLLDYSKNMSIEDVVTVLIPKGSNDLYLEDYYYIDRGLVSQYGRIEQTKDFNEIDNVTDLSEAAREYLSTEQFEKLVLELSVFDLHMLNPSIGYFNLLDLVNVKSVPHNIDTATIDLDLVITDISIKFDKPESTSIKVGYDSTLTAAGYMNKYSKQSKEDAKKAAEEAADNSPALEAMQGSFAIQDELTTGITKYFLRSQAVYNRARRTAYYPTAQAATYWVWAGNGPSSTGNYYSQNQITIKDDEIHAGQTLYPTADANGYDVNNTTLFQWNGQQLYYISIEGCTTSPYKAYTFVSPYSIWGSGSSDTEEAFNAKFAVRIPTAAASEIAAALEWETQTIENVTIDENTQEEVTETTSVRIPVIRLGRGDTSGNGKFEIKKNVEGPSMLYDSRTADVNHHGFKIEDDGAKLVTNDYVTNIPPMYIGTDINNVPSDLPSGTLIGIYADTSNTPSEPEPEQSGGGS